MSPRAMLMEGAMLRYALDKAYETLIVVCCLVVTVTWSWLLIRAIAWGFGWK